MKRHWPQITQKQYHAYNAVSSGALKAFAKDGPLEYWSIYVDGRGEREETDATKLGSAFHLCMSDPEEYDNSYIRIPTTFEDDEFFSDIHDEVLEKNPKAVVPKIGSKLNRKGDIGKLYYAAWEQKATRLGKDFLNDDQALLVKRQVNAVWDNTACREYLECVCHYERACIVTCEQSGLKIKALADVDIPDQGVFIDFKTTRAKNMHEFLGTGEWRGEFQRRGYDYQLAHYRYVLGRPDAKIITVTSAAAGGSKPPATVEAMLYSIPSQWLDLKHEENITHLKQLAQLQQQVADSEVDRDGIPWIYHNEGWGADIDPLEVVGDMSELRAATANWGSDND